MRLIAFSLVFSLAAFGATAHDHKAPAIRAKLPTRTVEVTMIEADGKMSFSPASITVARGEQVRFLVTNKGALPHEFVIGTQAENAEHAKMMAAMPDMKHDDANAVTVQPGKMATLTWRFDKSGAFEFACLIPGHYEAGMHGAVAVK